MYNDKMNEPALIIDLEYSRVKDICSKKSTASYTNNKLYPIRLLNEPIIENVMMELVKNLTKNHTYIHISAYWDINNDMCLTCVSDVKKIKLYGHYENGVTRITSHDLKFSSGELARYLSVNMELL